MDEDETADDIEQAERALARASHELRVMATYGASISFSGEMQARITAMALKRDIDVSQMLAGYITEGLTRDETEA